MAQLQAGHRVLKAIVKALGLEGQHVRRIVLDVEVASIAKLYVESYPTGEACEGVAAALANLSPDEIAITNVQSDGIKSAISLSRAAEPRADIVIAPTLKRNPLS